MPSTPNKKSLKKIQRQKKSKRRNKLKVVTLKNQIKRKGGGTCRIGNTTGYTQWSANESIGSGVWNIYFCKHRRKYTLRVSGGLSFLIIPFRDFSLLPLLSWKVLFSLTRCAWIESSEWPWHEQWLGAWNVLLPCLFFVWRVIRLFVCDWERVNCSICVCGFSCLTSSIYFWTFFSLHWTGLDFFYTGLGLFFFSLTGFVATIRGYGLVG